MQSPTLESTILLTAVSALALTNEVNQSIYDNLDPALKIEVDQNVQVALSSVQEAAQQGVRSVDVNTGSDFNPLDLFFNILDGRTEQVNKTTRDLDIDRAVVARLRTLGYKVSGCPHMVRISW